MKIVKFSINRPVTVFMFTVAAIIFGFISYSKLSLNLLPKISYPTLTIKTEYPGTAPSEIENIVSKPIEETCGVVDNVVRISSVSRAELSEVTVEFAWHTNMDFATLKVREKLDLLRLPVGAQKPIILRYDPNTEPIMKLGITGDTALSRIRYIAERELKQSLESIEGVAACSISGGLEDEIHIDIDEQKLSLLNIPITTVVNRLSQENVNLSAGILKQKDSRDLFWKDSRIMADHRHEKQCPWNDPYESSQDACCDGFFSGLDMVQAKQNSRNSTEIVQCVLESS